MTTPSASSPDLPPHRTVRVDLGPRSYDVLIGRGLLNQFGRLLVERQLHGQVFPITDSQLEGKPFLEALAAGLGPIGVLAPKTSIPFGEASKSMKNASDLLSRLAKQKVPRSGIIIAI